MADNTTLNAGSGGDVIATDDIAGVKHQQVKVEWGVDGTATPVSAANPMPVVQTGTHAVNATLAAETTKVIGTVNIAASQTVTAVGAAAEDAAVSGNPVLIGGRYDSSARTLETGDAGAIALNASGQVLVEIAAGAGSGGTSAADGATFTRNTTSITPAGAVVESSAPTLTNGDVAGLSQTTGGALRVAVASGGITGAVEDAVASGSAEGVLSIVVRDDALSTLTPADGDYTAQRVNARGATWVALDSTAAQTVTLAAGTATNEVVGDAAHDAAISGNPIRLAGRALTADYTAVAAGDTADLITTLLGKLVTIPYANPNQSWSYAAPAGGLVSTTAVTIKTAAGAGVRNYITHIDVVNSNASTSTELVINDGAAGTVLWRGWLQAAGGGYSIDFNPPLRGTANTLLEIDEVTATATAGVLFNCTGFTAAE